MSLANKSIFLGSGTSTGVPLIGCQCQVCRSTDTHDKRMRQSIYLTTKSDKNILIDTSPDLRSQFLRSNLTKLDFCFITHDHADHLHGIDDVRAFCFGPPSREINIYILEEHKVIIESRFPYIFNRNNLFNKANPYKGGGLPLLNLKVVTLGKNNIEGEEFEIFKLPHGNGTTMGLFHQGLAYIIDCHEIPDEAVHFLKGKTKILIIDCLQKLPHQTHLNTVKAFDYIRRISPEKAFLTHMNHDLSHSDLLKMAQSELGPHVSPAYDMCQIDY